MAALLVFNALCFFGPPAPVKASASMPAGTYADSPQPGQIRIYAGAEAGNSDPYGNRMVGSIVEEKYLDQNSGSVAAIEAQGNGVADFERYGWHKKVTKRVANGNAYFTYKIPVDPSTPAPLYLAMEATGEIKLTAEGTVLLDTGNGGLGVQTPREFTLSDPALWADGFVELKFEDADPSDDNDGVNLLWLELGPSSVWRGRVKHILWDTSDVLWQVGYYEGTASEFKGSAAEITVPGGNIETLAGTGTLTIRWNQPAVVPGKQYFLLAGIIGGAGNHTFDIGADNSVEAMRVADKERITDLEVTQYLSAGGNAVRIGMAPGAKLDFVSLVEVTEGATSDDALRVVFKGHEMAEYWTRLVNTTMYFHMDMMTEKSTGFIDASLPNGIFPLLYWVADAGPAMLEMARWGYTEAAKQATLFRTAQNHYSGDNGAAGLVFATIAYLMKGDNYTGDYVTKAWPVLKDGLDYYVDEIQNSPYHLIKGTGLETTNNGYGIYNNTIAYFALLAGAEAAEKTGHTAEQASWLAAADLLAQGITDHLIADRDISWLGRTIKQGTWRYSLDGNKSDGSDAPWINAGWFGVGSAEELYYGYKKPQTTRNNAVETWRQITDKTLDYHSENFWADWKLYGHNRGFGTDYGVLSERAGWPLLTMLMSDRMDMARKNLHHVIWNSSDLNFDHDNEGVQETSPWVLVREVNATDHGIALPNEIGNGGSNEDMNLVEYIMALKNVRIMAGLDDTLEGGDNVIIVPRIPYGWTGVKVNRWPSHYRTGTGDIGQTHITYDYTILPERATLKIAADDAIAGTKFRFGPFAKDAVVVAVTENGSAVDASRIREELSGDAKWVWVDGEIATTDITYQVDVQIPDLVFANDFETGDLTGWNSLNGDNWNASAGTVRGQSAGGDLLLYAQTQTDLVYSADVNIRQGAAGLSFRVDAAGTEGYDFVLDTEAGSEGEIRLATRQGDVLWSAPLHINRNRTYNLKVVAAGPILMGYLDGTKVFHMVDSAHLSGSVGFHVRGDAAFDSAILIGSAASVEIPTLQSATISSYKTDTMLMTQEKEIPVIATFDNGETLNVTGLAALREYHFSNPGVLEEQDGLLVAKQVGTTDVYATVTINGVTVQSNTLTMKVEELSYVEIYYPGDELSKTVMIGETAQVWPWAKLSDGVWWFLGSMPPSMSIVYTSSDPDVATVVYDPANPDPESRSILHAHGVGTATITMEVTVNGVTVASPNAITVTVIDPDEFPGFADDFEDGDLAGWNKSGPGTWTVEDGRAVVSNPPPTGWDSWNIVNALGRDFVYSGDVTILDGQAAGLSFRTNDTGSKGYDVILDKYDGLKLAGRPYQALKSVGMTVENNRTYHIKVVAKGSTFKVYLDGELKIDYTDTTFNYTFGKFGMFSFQSTAAFDNLKAETSFKLEQVQATVDKAVLGLGETATVQLSGKLNSEEPADLTDATIHYTSDDPSVATVDASGVVTAVGAGTANIAAEVTLDGTTVMSNAVPIAVYGGDAGTLLDSVTVTLATYVLRIGDTTPVIVHGKLANGSPADLGAADIIYASDNPAVASVAADGTLTAHKLGTARITATVTLEGVTKTSSPVEVTVAGTQAFTEDFDDGDAAGWTPNGGVWSVADGKMRVEYLVPNSWFDAWNIFDKQGDNFVYTGEVNLIEGNSAGLSFRTNHNGTQGYDIIFSIYDGLKLAKRPYSVIAVFNDFTPELPKSLNFTYRIKVIADGPRIQVYLNDQPVIDATDSTYASGYFGLFAFQGTAEYDNLVVTELDTTPPAWPSGTLTASGITENSLELQWTAAQDLSGVAGYRVYQDGRMIGETDGSVQNYSVTGLAAGTSYTFKVEAGDAHGNWSVDGPSLTVSTASPPVSSPPGEPPASPPPAAPAPSETPASPMSPTSPPLPASAQPIPASALRPGEDGVARVGLEPGKTEAVLPAGAASLLGGGTLEIEGERFTVSIDAGTLQAAMQGTAGNARLVVGIQTPEDAQVRAWIENGSGPNVRLRQAGPVQTVTFAVLTESGETIPLPSGSILAQLVFTYDEDTLDERLLGAYRYDESTGIWEFIPGAVDRSRNRVVVSGTDLRNVAILVYDRTFDDVDAGHWVNDALKVLAAQHLVNGTTETTFSPARPVTRAEYTAMLVRALGLRASQSATFTDVEDGAWYAESVAAAAEAGLIRGREDGSFDPDGAITREEMAALLVRALQYLGGEAGEVGSDNPPPADFRDGDQISGWALADVARAVEAGLMKGIGGNLFAPRSAVTRAEAAQALFNLLFR